MICICSGLHRPRRGPEPVAPRPRLVGIAGAAAGAMQRERGVPQPAVAIVPVAHSAQLLRQRRGWRRDDAAGRARRSVPSSTRSERQHLGSQRSPVAAAAHPLAPTTASVSGHGLLGVNGHGPAAGATHRSVSTNGIAFARRAPRSRPPCPDLGHASAQAMRSQHRIRPGDGQ